MPLDLALSAAGGAALATGAALLLWWRSRARRAFVALDGPTPPSPADRFQIFLQKDGVANPRLVYHGAKGGDARRFMERYALRGDQVLTFYDSGRFRGRRSLQNPL